MIATDQAETLRTFARNHRRHSQATCNGDGRGPQVIAVTSGKGGVGKTNLVANLAIALARQGKRVLAVDGDLGMANLDLAMGITSRGSLSELIEGDAPIDELLAPAATGVWVLPACSGSYELANLSDLERMNLFAAIDNLEDRFDVLVIDVASGIGPNAIAFGGAAEQVLVVASPEPTSLADAYGFIKVLTTRCDVKSVQVVANMVSNLAEGEEVFRRLCTLSDRFLRVRLDYMGAIVQDSSVPRGVRAGVPVLVDSPNSPASRCIVSIASRIASMEQPSEAAGSIRLFWKKLMGRGAVA